MIPKFFSETANVNAAEMREYLPVNVSINYDTMAPALGDAEQKYILPTIGETTFNDLASYYESGSTGDTERELLITRLQSAVVRLAFYESFDLYTVTLTDSGLQDNNGDSRAYRYQADAAKRTLGRQAFEHLQYFYDAFIASTLYTSGKPKRSSALFPTYSEFFTALGIAPDFRLFNKLLPQINAAEQIDLPTRIGSTLAKEMINTTSERMHTDTLMWQAQLFIANKVMADSIMTLHAYISDDGATTRTIGADGQQGGTSKATATESTRLALQKEYAKRAEAGAFSLVTLLKSDTATYPEILKVATNDNQRTHLPKQNNKTFRV